MKMREVAYDKKVPMYLPENKNNVTRGHRLSNREVNRLALRLNKTDRLALRRNKEEVRTGWPASPEGRMAVKVGAASLVAGLLVGLWGLVERACRPKGG